MATLTNQSVDDLRILDHSLWCSYFLPEKTSAFTQQQKQHVVTAFNEWEFETFAVEVWGNPRDLRYQNRYFLVHILHFGQVSI